ncbi:hypothetical protein Amac_094520 [Acrocarpospora macrocephala]|uniref:2'-5' RNA ligase n=2 Tax=Acrocarpospora macrocephala TaxID=150177 RepID=A0A5M3X3Z0_9ACTN|nr:DUF1045 domain-containing protein [Acrocarpospora macrocephala]GES15854.1 hypothetical protein Amac_094520 [Acrocarpospora macrocephala]
MVDLPVYDAVLLPPEAVNAGSIRLSEWCASQTPAEFTLKAGELYPHISLYMANFTPADLDSARDELRLISKSMPEIPLAADHFSGNDQGMFELFYRKTEAVTRLQESIIERLNPLRTGLRLRDPVGRVLADHRLSAPPTARANLDRYGYDEIGDLFRPHITMTRFRERGHQIAADLLPPPESFTAVYRTLALCVMGEHGTCTEIVETFELASER